MRSIGNVDVDVVRAEYRKKPRKAVDVLKLVNRAMTQMLTDIEAMVSTHHSMLADSDCIDVIENSVLETNLPQGSIDHIITSPPYGVEASSYLRTHLLSYRSLQPILNYDPYTMNSRIIGSEYVSNNDIPNPTSIAASMSETFVRFFDVQLGRETSSKVISRKFMMMHFFDDMVTLATQFHNWLRPGGRIAFVVGNKRVGNYVVPTDAIVAEIFHASGLELDGVIQHKLKFNNSNSEVPWQERTIQDEFVMLFTRR
jgi:tRNA G10  N-methylase Trm11